MKENEAVKAWHECCAKVGYDSNDYHGMRVFTLGWFAGAKWGMEETKKAVESALKGEPVEAT